MLPRALCLACCTFLQFRTSAVGCVNGDVLDVFPGAQLFLSGSMYMGTATENSDGDVVVVLPKAGKDGGKARLEKLVGRFTDRSNVYSRVKHIEAGDPPLIKVVIRLAAVDKEAPEDSVFEVDIAYGFCTDTTPPHDIEAGILHEDFRRLLAKVHVRPGMKINVLAAVISNHHLINQLEAAGVLELWRELVLLLREWCRVRSLDQGVFGGLRPVTIGIVAALVLLRMVTDQVDLSGPDCYEVMMRHALEYVVNIVIRVKDKTEQSPPVLLRVLLTQQDKEDLRRQQRDQALTVADFTGRSNTTHGVSYGTRACLGTHARADAERLGEGRGASIFDWSSNLSTISVFVLTTVQMGFVLATRVVYQSSAHQTAAVVPHEVTAGVTYTAKQTSRALDDLLKARGGITEHQPHTKIYAISPSGHQCEPKHTDETTTSFGLFHRE